MSWLNQIALCGVVKGPIAVRTFPGTGGMIAEFTLTTLASFVKGKHSETTTPVEKEEDHCIVVNSKDIILEHIQGALSTGDCVTLSGRLQYRDDPEHPGARVSFVSVKRGNQFSRFEPALISLPALRCAGEGGPGELAA